VLLVTLIMYVLGCALMVGHLRVSKPGWAVGWLLIIIWIWPFWTATYLVHNLIEPLFVQKAQKARKKGSH
jgi:hypothetical protein